MNEGSVTYVTDLERTVQILRLQVAELNKVADQWQPKVSSEMLTASDTGRVTLHFNGKAQAVAVSTSYLASSDLVSATSTILGGFAEMINAQLRPLIQVEVDRLIKNAKVTSAVSKW